jgi:hypothetical protein
VGDVAVRLRFGAEFLNANVVHVEHAIACQDVAGGVDGPDFVAERAASAEPLDEIDIGLERWPEA